MNRFNDYSERLVRFAEEGRLRSIPPDRGSKPLIDLTSNDYLGLASRNREFIPEFMERFGNPGMSASASRLLAVGQSVFHDTEDFLSSLYGRPALLFNSGYHANVGITTSLNTPETLFLVDRQIHASVYDGLTMQSAEFRRFPHNDMEKLRSLLKKESSLRRRIVVMVESVYSMDGDMAPLESLVELRREFPAMILYVDEAHALGTHGRRGLGLAEELGVIDEVDVMVGTFGKALASVGAFCITHAVLRDWFVNTSRPLIFSTSLPPANVAWSRLMMEKNLEMTEERIRLKYLSDRLRKGISDIGFSTPSTSQIIPLVTGDPRKAGSLSDLFLANGILALPIRRPTVSPGQERVRLSLTASLDENNIDHILSVIQHITK